MSHSYEKHTWSVGEVITKALIDRMEIGIDNAVDKSGDTITYKLDFVKNSSPQQKGTVLWDETTGYGRMKIQQYAQVTTLGSDGFYKNDDPNHTVADTYSFPKKAVDVFTAANYNIFTSKGAIRGIAWFNDEDTTEGNNGILNYLEIDNNANGKILRINSNGEPTWATGNYTLSLNGNTLSLIPGTTTGTSTVTLASGVAYSLAADNVNNKIYLSGSTGDTGFTVTKGTNETLSLNQTTHLIDCKIPTLKAADERYVNVSGDTMTGRLTIGSQDNLISSAINTYGSNALGGWTAIYADRTNINSNASALRVYGQSQFEKSVTILGEMRSNPVVATALELNTGSGTQPQMLFKYHTNANIGDDLKYQILGGLFVRSTDPVGDLLALSRSSFFSFCTYPNAAIEDETGNKYLQTTTSDSFSGLTSNSTWKQNFAQKNPYGSTHFYFPTVYWSEWLGDATNAVPSTQAEKEQFFKQEFFQSYEIFTTKNYEMRNGTFTLKDIFNKGNINPTQKTINDEIVNVYVIKAISTSGYNGPLISASINFTDNNTQIRGFSNNNYSINVTSCSSYSGHWAGHFATFLPYCLWQGVPNGQTTFIFQLIVTQDVEILQTDAEALTFNYIAISANPETLGNE